MRTLFLIFIGWFSLCGNKPAHPLYMSVLEIEHNEQKQRMEMSCRVFVIDFEETLRKYHKEKIDILSPTLHDHMGNLMNGYIHEHLKIKVNGKELLYSFVGYEQAEESVQLYFESSQKEKVSELLIHNDILYDFQSKQMNLIHVTVKGERKSTRLNYPDAKAVFQF